MCKSSDKNEGGITIYGIRRNDIAPPALSNCTRIPFQEAAMSGPFTLAPLPWDEDALAPHISGRTISFHYGKHHKKYVDTLNELVAGTAYAQMTLDAVVRATADAAAGSKEKKIFDNAAQAWNHDFYWRSLTPKSNRPTGTLAAAIERDFGDRLADKLAEEGTAQFGSGWVWLVSKDGKLAVEKTHDAMTPMAKGATCLLCIDVWEHAYYLDYQNERPKYLKTVLDKIVNWDFAAQNLASTGSRPLAAE
jgi:Fe-Mn family superoxide dismutase